MPGTPRGAVPFTARKLAGSPAVNDAGGVDELVIAESTDVRLAAGGDLHLVRQRDGAVLDDRRGRDREGRHQVDLADVTGDVGADVAAPVRDPHPETRRGGRNRNHRIRGGDVRAGQGPEGVLKVQKKLASVRFPCEAAALAVPPRRTRSVKGLVVRSSATISATGATKVTGAEMNGDGLGPLALVDWTPIR